MKKILLQFFSVETRNAEPEDLDHALRVATAVLMVEAMRADFAVAPAERDRLRQLLARQFELPKAELDALLEEAEADADRLVSLQHATRLINENYDHAMKVRIVEMLWHLAYADGEKDHHEEHLIRQVAELLYVSHGEFIQARHRAEPE